MDKEKMETKEIDMVVLYVPPPDSVTPEVRGEITSFLYSYEYETGREIFSKISSSSEPELLENALMVIYDIVERTKELWRRGEGYRRTCACFNPVSVVDLLAVRILKETPLVDFLKAVKLTDIQDDNGPQTVSEHAQDTQSSDKSKTEKVSYKYLLVIPSRYTMDSVARHDIYTFIENTLENAKTKDPEIGSIKKPIVAALEIIKNALDEGRRFVWELNPTNEDHKLIIAFLSLTKLKEFLIEIADRHENQKDRK